MTSGTPARSARLRKKCDRKQRRSLDGERLGERHCFCLLAGQAFLVGWAGYSRSERFQLMRSPSVVLPEEVEEELELEPEPEPLEPDFGSR